MTKLFEHRIIREGIVDTKKYRYHLLMQVRNGHFHRIIRRLPIELLDTTAAIDNWEIVKDEIVFEK